jgi:hypothetical protein
MAPGIPGIFILEIPIFVSGAKMCYERRLARIAGWLFGKPQKGILFQLNCIPSFQKKVRTQVLIANRNIPEVNTILAMIKSISIIFRP